MNGGVPATVGVLNGQARVGMEAEELIQLTASAGKDTTMKVSRRDLGYICGLGLSGRKLNGGTTVAGTMVLSHLAGIKVFATGGLGGVHRGAENSLDISADLTELGRTPVAVISSGCKSFLDIPKTLEYLETQGVGVGTFADGREGDIDFPAFWSRESGIQSPMVIANEIEAAAMIYAQSMLPISSGLNFANPIPLKYSIPKSDMDSIITEAIREAEVQGASGSDNTPFILAKIKELSKGESKIANRALIESNVARGTAVAVQLAKLERREEGLAGREASVTPTGIRKSDLASRMSKGLDDHQGRRQSKQKIPDPSTRSVNTAPIDIMVAGSVAVDLSCDLVPTSGSSPLDESPKFRTSNPSLITQTLGGVGRNIAMASHLLGASVHLCGSIADDLSGRAAMSAMKEQGLDTAGIRILGKDSGQRTAQYVSFNDAKKELVMAMADMHILEDSSNTFETMWKSEIESTPPKWLVVDANWSPATLRKWVSTGQTQGSKIVFEPVSAAKSTRLFSPAGQKQPSLGTFPNHQVDMATPNSIELSAMFNAARDNQFLDRQDWWHVIDSLGIPAGGARDRLVAITTSSLVDRGIPQQAVQLLPFIPCILTKLGSQGVLLTRILQAGDERLISPTAAPYILSRTLGQGTGAGGIYMRLFPPARTVRDEDIVSVNGVGDTFLGVILAGLVMNEPLEIEQLVQIAQNGSVMTLGSKDAVHPNLGELTPLLASKRQ
ncbi:MAG: hypothetical protein M1837_006092 [Sclerophora amabilis]|nr:MAG: hypothetical protein M1837_006092 [Sclerophora amabilis]